MNKFILALGLTLVSVSAKSSPLFLTFRNIDGSECSFATSSLSITVGDGKLHVSNSEKTAELDLSTLISMKFTDKEAESGLVESVSDKILKVYSLKGEYLGSYNSMGEVRKSLPKGTYIVKSGDKTEKKTIK